MRPIMQMVKLRWCRLSHFSASLSLGFGCSVRFYGQWGLPAVELLRSRSSLPASPRAFFGSRYMADRIGPCPCQLASCLARLRKIYSNYLALASVRPGMPEYPVCRSYIAALGCFANRGAQRRRYLLPRSRLCMRLCHFFRPTLIRTSTIITARMINNAMPPPELPVSTTP